MRLTFLLVSLLLLTVQAARAGHTPKTEIFLRVHVQTGGQGLSPQEAMTVTIPPDNDTLLVRAMPEVTEHNLVDVKADASGEVRLFFDHQGQVNLNAVTAENQGRILVVMINGVVVYAPTIDEQIGTGELDIPRQLNPLAIKLLQDTAQQNVKEANRK